MPYAVIKRVIDLAASLVACVVLLPVFVLIALAICVESSGAPIFTQRRVGLYGREFAIFKFRSMVKNAASQGLWYTTKDDPRITRVGKFLRATSLDELPQLWNVTLGDMSLVGPRPNLASQQSQYSAADWQLRHRVRPGITGLAQVSGRSALSEKEQIRYDLAYAANPTLLGDMRILWRTVLVVVGRVGVN